LSSYIIILLKIYLFQDNVNYFLRCVEIDKN
jgi:hypothetical protein